MNEDFELPDIDELTDDEEIDLSFDGNIYESNYHPIMDDIERYPHRDSFRFGKKINKVTTESLFINSDDGITIKPDISNVKHYKLDKDGIKGENLVRLKFLGKYSFMEEKSEFVFSERLM